MLRPPPRSTLLPYTTLFRSQITSTKTAGSRAASRGRKGFGAFSYSHSQLRSEEHTSELQSRLHLVCRLLLEKHNTYQWNRPSSTCDCATPPSTRRCR